jgi:hypothetical protein
LAVVALGAAGCIQTKEHVTVRADGSGTVTMEVVSQVPVETLRGMGAGMRQTGNTAPEYPPLSKAMVEKLFPGKDFVITVKEDRQEAGETKLVVEVAFKDVNALLASSYGKAHALALVRAGDTLTFKALSGLQNIAGAMGNPEFSEWQENLGDQLGSAIKKDLSCEFKLTLPHPVSAANGPRDGSTTTWSVTATTTTNMTATAAAFSRPMTATCAASGVTFTPNGPVRMSLATFAELKAGPLGDKVTVPDAAKVAAGVRFVPCRLVTQRTFSLTGERSYGGNQATLAGLVVVPRELAPSKFGAAKLTEVVDDKGRNLKMNEDGDGERFMRMGESSMDGADEEDGEEKDQPAAPAEVHRMVTLLFKAPERTAREISRVQATMELNYYGAGQVVKVEKAIEAGQILDMTKMRSYSSSSREDKTPLVSPALKELGLIVTPQMCMKRSVMTMLQLEVRGKQAAIEEVQVYDSAGQPCPTFSGMESSSGDGATCQVMVSGPATPPLSLGLVVRQVGTPVTVPIRLEHVPLTTPPPATAKN